MKSFIDQTGREVRLRQPVKRIVSLVPSQTELLHALGLEDEVIAITKFCIHPEAWFTSKLKAGGTKDFKIDLIRSLKPDLILANKEENTKAGLLELAEEFPVWISDVNSLEEALEMIRQTGYLTGRTEPAETLISDIRSGFDSLKEFTETSGRKESRVAYYIWKDPWMVAGQNTFINDLLKCCGLLNISSKSRYPVLSCNELVNNSPDYLFLSSEPFPFTQVHLDQFKGVFPLEKIKLVNGEYFSWYGSRLKLAPSYFISMLKSLV